MKFAIQNYRCIDRFEFRIDALGDKSATFGLVGVNEAGKTSILKALALKDGLSDQSGQKLPLQKDFADRLRTIRVEYFYDISSAEIDELIDTCGLEDSGKRFDKRHLSQAKITAFFEYSNPASPKFKLEFPKYPKSDLKMHLEEVLLEKIIVRMHSSVFWTAEPRFLISNAINLSEFADNPEGISIPLKNSFLLADIASDDFKREIAAAASDSTELEHLEERLSEAVTKHINTRWPDHPIRITFKINDGMINFHVRDTKVGGKPKTADQRSDGFKQFISFLLTISAQHTNEELTETILLLDEPETHLHPKAQEDLLRELIKISSGERNNIALFATHSIFMIDRHDLSRNFKIAKSKEHTEIGRFDPISSTFASVIYDVFDIPSEGYHSQLYSRLHAMYQEEDESDAARTGILNFDENYLVSEKKLKKDKPWKGKKNSCSLPTYIRNCVNHPDNGNQYTEKELIASIQQLKSFIT
ncbi:AAA ATPase-like protein [Maritalea mobilis]|uniref:AAA ATPase-like protein n=1 Tax=Maritalea mobilis TaxID=483324 RepID=A0A4R6VNZ3_9HYPH|nr:ATP-binding protein [Maritalea mobilis]TDQ63930.1 AAA ATPase-like protein [Maritalea mobilis]